jgi:ArsR family transcriptional regulator, arsenate/arsenite/antimonite-responsive transcriptional repressor
MANQTVPSIDEKMRQAVTAMSEATRLQILLLLGQKGELCVNDIAAQFSISRPAVSHHLKIMKDNGLVMAVREGQEIYYRMNKSYIVKILRTWAEVLETCCQDK